MARTRIGTFLKRKTTDRQQINQELFGIYKSQVDADYDKGCKIWNYFKES